MKPEQRIHKVDPITVNGIKIFQVIIDAHYEEKHHSYTSDDLILNLVKSSAEEIEEGVENGFSEHKRTEVNSSKVSLL